MNKLREYAKRVPGLRYAVILSRQLMAWLRYQAILPLLHPVFTDKQLIRFGPVGDGGYLIPDDLEGISACFSPGVSLVSGFEKDCAKRNMKVFLADASVDAPAETHPLFNFSKKYIGGYARENYITLEEWIECSSVDTTADLIMQMDIENFEWEVLDSTKTELLQRFRIIVVEFHWLDNLTEIKARVFRKLLETHACVHIHPNNVVPPKKIFNLVIPPLMEVTFLRRDRISKCSYRSDFPHSLDSDNTENESLVLPKNWYRR